MKLDGCLFRGMINKEMGKIILNHFLSRLGKISILRSRQGLYFWGKYGCLMGIIIIIAIFCLIVPGFATLSNWISVLRLISIFTIIGMGEATVMIVQGVDMSVGATAGFCGYLCTSLLAHGYGLSTSFLATVGVGTSIGIFNAILTSWLGINAMVATLGTMFILISLALMMSNGGYSVYLFTMSTSPINAFLDLGNRLIGGLIPVDVVVMMLVSTIMWVVIRYTIIGRYFYSIGENIKASYLSGIKIRFFFGLAFVISGLFAAIAGVMMAFDSGVGTPPGGPGYLLEALCVAALSTAIFGEGEINIEGVLVGAIFIGALSNGLVLLGCGPAFDYLFKGLVILIGMGIGSSLRYKS